MRILLAHNYYQQAGGEDRVFEGELRLLRERGHDVVPFSVHNDQIERMGRLSLIAATFWNSSIALQLAQIVRQNRIEVAHFHNTFPLISPAAFGAVRSAGAAVVQTLHNFRMLCLNAVLFRENATCERCVRLVCKWPGILRGCYRGSGSGSAVVAGMLAAHRLLRTQQRNVDLFVVPSRSAERKLREGGLPPPRIMVKPHFVDGDPGVGDGSGGYAIFVGRLSYEKGVVPLLDAWRDASLPPLKIIGDGPLAPAVREACNRKNVEWLGRRPMSEVYDLVGRAAVLVLPSVCYETFGRVAAEAFAKGTPVIASDIGAMAEIVSPGKTGLHFRAGDPSDLAAKVRELLTLAPVFRGEGWVRATGVSDRLAEMRRNCRREYERNYTADANYPQLLSIYQRAVARRGAP